MIRSIACDIECFENLFSATFVDVQDYLKVFKDCEGMALTECLSVADIKKRLDEVKCKIFLHAYYLSFKDPVTKEKLEFI